MIAENGWHFYERLWRPGQLVVSDMERNGCLLDEQACEVGRAETEKAVAEYEQQLNEWAGQEIAWGSPQQKAQFLYGTKPAVAVKNGPLILPKGFQVPPICGGRSSPQLTEQGKRPTDYGALSYLLEVVEDEADLDGLQLMLDYAEVRQLLGFWKGLPSHVSSDGRVHPQLGAITVTGRLSSRNPNLQNIPVRSDLGKLLRKAFIPRPGNVLVCLDYSGLEWRILGHILASMFDDWSIVEEVKDGVDPHSATAVRMRWCPGPVEKVKELYPKKRDDGKTLNYGTIYGKTAAGYGIQLKDENGRRVGKRKGQEALDAFYKARPGIKQFQDAMASYGEAKGYVRSLLGRHRFIPQLRSATRGIYNSGKRKAANVVQNCASDVVTLAMLKTCPIDHPELRHLGWHRPELAEWGVEAQLQVHDELLFEVAERHAERAQQVLSEQMEHCLDGVREFLCPLEVDGGYGTDWLSAGGK